MMPYYADARKYYLNTRSPVIKSVPDKAADQIVSVIGSISGVIVRPDRRWTPFCEKLFRRVGANTVCLEEISSAPDSSLQFINELPGCRCLSIKRGKQIDLSPLAGNSCLEDLQIYPLAQCMEFDLATLPKLQRCQIPLRPEMMSFMNCRQLISLCLSGGRHQGILGLESIPSLEEFICIRVINLRGVAFHPKVHLRSLELSDLKNFESIEPQDSVTRELLVVELNRLPKMGIDWLRHAANADCIALRLGTIPSIKFLSGLKRLKVLDLFGTKVADGDLSFRDSLKGELSSALWSKKSPSVCPP